MQGFHVIIIKFFILIIIVFRGVPTRKIKLKKTGACYLARWIAKSLYALTFFLFKSQFKLSNQKKN